MSRWHCQWCEQWLRYVKFLKLTWVPCRHALLSGSAFSLLSEHWSCLNVLNFEAPALAPRRVSVVFFAVLYSSTDCTVQVQLAPSSPGAPLLRIAVSYCTRPSSASSLKLRAHRYCIQYYWFPWPSHLHSRSLSLAAGTFSSVYLPSLAYCNLVQFNSVRDPNAQSPPSRIRRSNRVIRPPYELSPLCGQVAFLLRVPPSFFVLFLSVSLPFASHLVFFRVCIPSKPL